MSEPTQNFILKLQSLWSVEDQLVNALPKMTSLATDFGLVKALSFHYAETQQHRTAIEAICKQLGVNPQGAADEQLATILSENEGRLSKGANVDELIIAGAQSIEQYEIAAYQIAADEAKRAGMPTLRKRLLLTLEEEKQAGNKLAFLLKALHMNQAGALELNMQPSL